MIVDIDLFEYKWNLVFSRGEDKLRRVARIEPVIVLLNTDHFLEVIGNNSINKILKILNSKNL